MADDSNEIQQELEFHPCLPPRGILKYDLDLLSDYQKSCLKDYKLAIIRENNMYLHRHPEIKLLISILLKEVLIARPKMKLEYFLAKYFRNNWEKLKVMVEEVAKQNENATEYSPESPFRLPNHAIHGEQDTEEEKPHAHPSGRNVMFRSISTGMPYRTYAANHRASQDEDAEEEGEEAPFDEMLMKHFFNSNFSG